MKPTKDLDELCYSFIYDTSHLCDFEVATDELCGHIGAALSLLPPGMNDIAADLDRLQPLAFHANGSVRGRLALEESDLAWLKGRLGAYRQESQGSVTGFILPRGDGPVPALHLGRSAAKKAIRALVRVEQEGRRIPMIVPRFCNLVCNFLFALTIVINRRCARVETPFVSKSYG